MPLYDYSCPNDHTQEVRHKMTELPEVACDQCGQPMKRMISAPWLDQKACPTRTGIDSFTP